MRKIGGREFSDFFCIFAKSMNMDNCTNCNFIVRYHRDDDDGSHTQFTMADFDTEDEAKAFVAERKKDLVEGEWLEIIDNRW